KGSLERGSTESVIDQLTPSLLDVSLEAGELAFDCDVLELLMRGDEGDCAGGFVDLAALDANEPVLDQVEPAHSLSPGTTIELLDSLMLRYLTTVYGHQEPSFYG